MNSDLATGSLSLVIKAFEKVGLALLFFLMGITWILINPLISLAMEPRYFDAMGVSPWDGVGAMTWIASLIYIAIGVMLLLRKYKPSVKIPEMAYTVAFGALALLALIDLISLKDQYPRDLFAHFDSLAKELQTYIVMSYIAAILNLLALVGVVALMLTKGKFNKYFWVPGALGAFGALMTAIGSLVYVSRFKDAIPKYSQSGYIFNIVFGLFLGLALLVFCYGFILNAETQEVAEKAENTPVASEAAATEAAPKLTQKQQEALDAAKEYFELGAYSEEEYEAEKKRILNEL